MDPLFVILIIIIILACIYIFFRNKQYHQLLESFNSPDTDSYMFRKKEISNNLKKVGWDGVWENKNNNIHGQFIQNNDKLIISLSNNLITQANYNSFNNQKIQNEFILLQNNDHLPNMYNINIYYIDEHNCEINIVRTDADSGWSTNPQIQIFSMDKLNSQTIDFGTSLFNNNTKNSTIPSFTLQRKMDGCPENSFVGICQLDKNRRKFTLTELVCNNYKDINLVFEIDKLFGELTKENDIILYSPQTNNLPLLFKKKHEFNYNSSDSKYTQNESRYLNSYPIIPESDIIIDKNFCQTGVPCIDKSNGLSSTTYNNSPYNACGTLTSETDHTCKATPNCVLYSPAPNGISTCPVTRINLYDYMNFMPLHALGKSNGNSLQLCNYLDMFTSSTCNSCILCYINNLGDVKTLNYQFLGISPKESSLTVQYDIMYDYLNKSVLPKYRSVILENNSSLMRNAISFTNCLGNNDITKCASICKKYVNQNKLIPSNNNLQPAIWTINQSQHKNTLNSCTFTLSTSNNYPIHVKYAEFNSDGSTNLSEFGGGDKQNLVFEDVTVLKKYKSNTDAYIALTANIKTNDNLYLLPANNVSGFSNNSYLANLGKKYEENGKWLIIGFNLNNLSAINSIQNRLNSINLNP